MLTAADIIKFGLMTAPPNETVDEGAARIVAALDNAGRLAVAPDLAQIIPGMRWQWGVERSYRSGTETAVVWFSSEDEARQEIDNPRRQHGNPFLVRRLVGPVEVAK